MSETPAENWKPDPHILSIVRPALDKMWEEFVFEPDPEPAEGAKRVGAYFNRHMPKTWTNLRLDWEIFNSSAATEEVNKLAIKAMDLGMELDLCDLLENGDQFGSNEPLLGMMDGSKKLGKTLVGLDIVSLQLFAVSVERKDAVEYTLYVSIKPEWSDAN